jgi:hypothetical protein
MSLIKDSMHFMTAAIKRLLQLDLAQRDIIKHLLALPIINEKRYHILDRRNS